MTSDYRPARIFRHHPRCLRRDHRSLLWAWSGQDKIGLGRPVLAHGRRSGRTARP